jgi:hypothetical protein
MLGLAFPAAATQPNLVEPRVAAATNGASTGALLVRERLDRGFQPAEKGETLYTRDTLMTLPGIKADVDASGGGVRLTLWGNLRQLSEFPGLQSAVILHDSRAFDLDVTLLRGRIVLTNRREKGPARVWVRLPAEGWQITLPNPGDAVGVERYGRWPRGTGFVENPQAADVPTIAVVLILVKGQAELKTEKNQYALTAPPGTGIVYWDSVVGQDGPPRRADKLPDWADPGRVVPAEGKTIDEVMERFAALKERTPAEALLHLLADADKDKDAPRAAIEREVALTGLQAIDFLEPVGAALGDPKHADTRDAAVQALRHWIGDSPGRDVELYRRLIGGLGYPPAQAATIMQLLHSPFDPGLAETYDTLLTYLQHDKLAIRELARWHLYRLAPAGRDIRYDPAAAPEERAKAVAAWKKLIADGKVLPK